MAKGGFIILNIYANSCLFSVETQPDYLSKVYDANLL